MNVAVIGNGGREHALAWKLAGSRGIDRLFVLPGNPGTHQLAENVAIDPANIGAVVKFAKNNAIDLVVVGPEDPLAAGMVDALQAEKIRAFGPNKLAARLEGDKWFAKELMRAQAVPTADARTFTHFQTAIDYVTARPVPVVIKASGLAKGKGVTVAYRVEDAIEAVENALKKKIFGDAGARIVVEECLTGPECSVMALVDKNSVYVLEPCQDHKQVDTGGTGPMTGGMGAFCPTPTLTPALLGAIERDVFVPVLDGLRRDGIDYKGVLYAGIMLTAGGPKVLEFNVRLGDPETQPLMMRLRSDLLAVLNAVVDGKLDEVNLDWDPRPAVGVVATSKGYPGKYETDKVITGIDAADAQVDTKVFHSGTKRSGEHTVTHGGRVLTVTALGDDLEHARERAYMAMKKVQFDGMHFRTDIAARPG